MRLLPHLLVCLLLCAASDGYVLNATASTPSVVGVGNISTTTHSTPISSTTTTTPTTTSTLNGTLPSANASTNSTTTTFNSTTTSPTTPNTTTVSPSSTSTLPLTTTTSYHPPPVPLVTTVPTTTLKPVRYEEEHNEPEETGDSRGIEVSRGSGVSLIVLAVLAPVMLVLCCAGIVVVVLVYKRRLAAETPSFAAPMPAASASAPVKRLSVPTKTSSAKPNTSVATGKAAPPPPSNPFTASATVAKGKPAHRVNTKEVVELKAAVSSGEPAQPKSGGTARLPSLVLPNVASTQGSGEKERHPSTEVIPAATQEDLAGDWIPPEDFSHKGPLVLNKHQGVDFRHALDDQSERKPQAEDHISWDDRHIVHEMGSEVEVVVSNKSKASGAGAVGSSRKSKMATDTETEGHLFSTLKTTPEE